MKVLRLFLLAAIIISNLTINYGQTPNAPASGEAIVKTGEKTGEEQPPPTNIANSSYRIGVGDLLDVRVYGVDQLNREVRVDSRGFISLPRVDEPLQAQCLTELELAQLIETKYSKYIRAPHVDVAVKDYQSLPVAVIGAVKQAGRFQLRRRVRLLELLTFAGGATEAAGAVINIVHNEDLITCDKEGRVRPGFETVAIEALYENQPNANFYVQPGDIINIPNANIITVAGNVVKPGIQPMLGPMTITKAIALAGGVKTDTAKDKIRVIRQNPGAADTEITVDLIAIEKKKAKDIELRSNDIVVVADSNTALKSFGRAILNTLGGTIGGAPVRVIP